MPSLELLSLSKDDRFALALSNISGSNQLWSANVRTGKMMQVSHGEERVIYANISPDSKTIVFTRDFAGAERHQFFLTEVESAKGEDAQVSALDDVRAYDFSWSPDGKEIAFCGSTHEAHHLWVLDPRTKRHGGLYSQEGSITSPAYSYDGRIIAASAKTTAAPRSSELLMVQRKTGEVTVYSPKPGSENAGPMWHPKEPKILFRTNAKGDYDLATYDCRGQTLAYVSASGLVCDFVCYGWSSRGDGIWFVGVKNGRTKLYYKRGKGKPKLVRTPVGRVSNAKLSRDGSFMVFSWSSLATPPQLLKLDVRTQRTSTIYSPPRDESLRFGTADFFTYTSADGLKIPAYMLFSGPKRPGPVIIWPHGGPWIGVSDEWNPAIQAICAAGFHVFCPNYRGSTGYGAAFERMDLGDAGGMDLQDVVAAAKFVRDKGYVEGDMLGIAGASYGGYLTYLAMTKFPDVWKAGASIAGVTDRLEQYQLSDAAWRVLLEQLLGKPEEKRDLYRDRSAINFVSQIKAPILIWHRANDSRCPLQPVQRFVDQLKALGKQYELHIVEGEGHGAQRTDNLVKQAQGVVGFLLKNLG